MNQYHLDLIPASCTASNELADILLTPASMWSQDLKKFLILWTLDIYIDHRFCFGFPSHWFIESVTKILKSIPSTTFQGRWELKDRPKWRRLRSFLSKFLVVLHDQVRPEYEGSEVVLPTNIKWVHTGPPKSKLQDPKSKLQDPNPQNQNSKIQNQSSKIQIQNSKIKTYINFWFMTGPPKKLTCFFLQIISTMSRISKWKSPKKSCKVRFINGCFLKIWNKLQKCAEKNRESFP